MGWSPFYKYSLDELEVVRKYLINNFIKGFIKLNNVTYATLILFVLKLNGIRLRFYIDYYKLNVLTIKDYYLLPLIEETLLRLGTTKVFTKLDIR